MNIDGVRGVFINIYCFNEPIQITLSTLFSSLAGFINLFLTHKECECLFNFLITKMFPIFDSKMER